MKSVEEIVREYKYLRGQREQDGFWFMFHYPKTNITLRVVASTGGGWDHVSVSTERRTPNWYELETVKKMVFKPNEIAMQLHMPESDHINIHPHVLHLWRPQEVEIPIPPASMV